MTGYMFGKGVYFSDMVSKSANYYSTSRSDNEGLCEVALETCEWCVVCEGRALVGG